MSMKKLSLIMSAGALCLAALPGHTTAQEPAEEPVVPYSPPLSSTPVAAALAKLPSYNGTPAADAKYYIFLESASWCSPCRQELPRIIRAYPDMRAHGVELVIIGRDTSLEAAQKYLSVFRAPFPGILGQEVDRASLPGFVTSETLPHVIIVDAHGNTIASEHGSATLNWQQIIANHESSPH